MPEKNHPYEMTAFCADPNCSEPDGSCVSCNKSDAVFHIVLPLYAPNATFLQAQLESLAQQDVGAQCLKIWVVIADLASKPLAKDLLSDLSPQVSYEICLPKKKLNAPQAFEFGLAEALAQSAPNAFFAFCDQDDIWVPSRLSAGVEALRRHGAQFVHSDARVINSDGSERHPSLFRLEGRKRHVGLRDLLALNIVTGMTCLFTHDVARTTLPFPKQSGVHFYHDLWVALVGGLFGPIAFIDQPLVAYRQHSANAVGALPGRPAQQAALFTRPWLRNKVATYARASFLAKSLYYRAQVALKVSDVPVDRYRLKVLKPYLGFYASGAAFLRDALKDGLRGDLKRVTASLSAAFVHFGRLAWVVREVTGEGARQAAFSRFDTRAYGLSPGCPPACPPELGHAEPRQTIRESGSFHDPRTRFSWSPDFSAARPAYVIVVPSLNPAEIFAGIATALDLGLAIAQRGVPVRFIASDLPVLSEPASRAFLINRISDLYAVNTLDITLHCGVTANTLPAHRADQFLATAWWTAQALHKLMQNHSFNTKRFTYLIQDHEPHFYPWGQDFAGAEASYHLPCDPVFNTTLLADYFAREGYHFGGAPALSFRPSIPLERYLALARKPIETKSSLRVGIYGRPEVARNLFPTCIETLELFLETLKWTRDDIEIVSIGLSHEDIRFPSGHVLHSEGKIPWDEYPEYLATLDVGLCLMHSPHPSHLPLEMAAAGVQVVTNRFANKNLSTLSPLIRSPNARPEALSAAMLNCVKSPITSPEARKVKVGSLGAPLDNIADVLVRRMAGRDARAIA